MRSIFWKKIAVLLPLPLLTIVVKSYIGIKNAYIDFRKLEDRFLIDNEGIPSVKFGYVDGKFIGIQKVPVTTCNYALDFFEDFKKTKNEKSRKFFINNANWLIKNIVRYDNYALLEYNFPWAFYNIKKPWRSAMAQGLALQVLIKAHEITGDKKYLEVCELLLNSFFIDVKDGGVTFKTNHNGWWYEEFAGEDCKISKVLNGMMFAVIGIYDYYKYTNNPNTKYLFDQGIISLKKELPKYDYHGYSYYDAIGKLASPKYHNIHLKLLKQLYRTTNEKIFKQYYEKWINPDYYKIFSMHLIEEIKNNNRVV